MKTGTTKWPLVVLFLGTALAGYGQATQTTRYEREQQHSDNAWMVISMHESGIALVRDKEKYRENKKLFEVVALDQELKEKWNMELELQNRLNVIGYEFANNSLYLLYRESESEAAALHLVKISIDTQEMLRYDINHEFNFKLTHFSIVGQNAVFGGYVNREPAVLLYMVADNQMKVVPGFFTSDTELLDLRVNQNQTFNTLVTNRSVRSNKKLVLRVFDNVGVQLMEDEIEVDQSKNILSGLTSTLVREELLISGTYTAGQSKHASGYFSVLADPFRDQAVNYYDFGQLDHSLDYMNPKRAAKIKENSRRDRERSRDPEFKCYASAVRLDEHPSGFLLLAELYNTSSGMGTYPYQGAYTPYASPYGFYYIPYMNRYYNSPYSYYNPSQNSDVTILESSVVVFSPEGKIDWDHSLKLDNLKKPSIEQSSDFWFDKNKIVIASKKESELFVKIRYKNDEVQSDTLKVMMKNPTDIVRNEEEEDTGIRYWYDNHFYTWGYQSIKDPAIVNEDRTRSVFYIVKIDVQ